MIEVSYLAHSNIQTASAGILHPQEVVKDNWNWNTEFLKSSCCWQASSCVNTMATIRRIKVIWRYAGSKSHDMQYSTQLRCEL